MLLLLYHGLCTSSVLFKHGIRATVGFGPGLHKAKGGVR